MLLTLDAVRRETWRVVVRTRAGRAAARDPDLRLAALGAGHLAVAFTLAALVPHWLLLVGPLILGIPHVLADFRLLLARGPDLARWRLGAVLVPAAAMLVLRSLQVHGLPIPHWTDVACGMVALTLALTTIPRRPAVRAAAFLAGAALTTLALNSWHTVALGFAHAHNLVALGVFAGFAYHRGLKSAPSVVLALALAGGLALWLGAAEWTHGVERSVAAAESTGLTLAGLAAGLAPWLEPAAAVRLVTVYAFLQAVHYTAWLRLNPAVWPGLRAAPTSFARDAAEWRAALGDGPAAAALLLCIAVPLVALLDAPSTRSAYLSVASFHGWMELAVLLHWAALRRSNP